MTHPDDATVVRVLAEREDAAYPGWTLEHVSDGRCWFHWEKTGTHIAAPDYLHSLDALRPVLAKLTPDERGRLAHQIGEQVDWPDGMPDWEFRDRCVMHALTLDPPVLSRAVAEAVVACRKEAL